jgi:hypothetical protein
MTYTLADLLAAEAAWWEAWKEADGGSDRHNNPGRFVRTLQRQRDAADERHQALVDRIRADLEARQDPEYLAHEAAQEAAQRAAREKEKQSGPNGNASRTLCTASIRCLSAVRGTSSRDAPTSAGPAGSTRELTSRRCERNRRLRAGFFWLQSDRPGRCPAHFRNELRLNMAATHLMPPQPLHTNSTKAGRGEPTISVLRAFRY